MRTSRVVICFTAVITILLADPTNAQTRRSSSRSVRQSERVARASWQPTRPTAQTRKRQSDQAAARIPLADRLRRVDHQEAAQELPAPPPEPINDPQPYSVVQPGPLDGQVVLEPLHEGTIACDALPSVACGCGDLGCVGDCGISCDSGQCGISGCSTCGELCSSEAWRPCLTLCLPQDGWASFEYLGWWQDGLDLPPLVTTSTDPNVARAQAGVLGSPTTAILFGGGEVLDDAFDGGRLRLGVWLDRCHTWGVGAEYFQIGSESESFVATSTGNPILARPFFNTQTGVEDSELVAFPNVLTGTVAATASSEFTGAGVHFRYLRCCDEGCSKWLFCGCPEHFCSRTEALMGYRFLELEETVQIREDLVSTDPQAAGSFDILDRFETRNQFNGFDIGWLYRRTRGFWTFDSMIRLAVGNTRQTVTITGQTTVNDPTADPVSQTLPGGLLAQTSNIGTFRQDQFTVVPEFNANVGYQLTDHVRVMLGYTFIYWSNVLRVGDHISRDLNPNLLPPPADPFSGAQRPAFVFNNTDYWAQGISFGGEYRW